MALIPDRDKAFIVDPAEAQTLEGAGNRLDTGMKVEEAVMRAINWWENRGRHIMRKELLRQAEPVGGANNGAGASFANLDPDSENFLPAGPINGRPWEQLTKDERLRVIKAWHHYAVRCPDMIGVGEDTDEDTGSCVTVQAEKRLKDD